MRPGVAALDDEADKIAEVMEAGAISAIGGGDDATACMKCNAVGKVSHCSVGGGASLEPPLDSGPVRASCFGRGRGARIAKKGPEVELKPINASYDAEYLADQMKYDSKHGRGEGLMELGGDSPEVELKLTNACCDAEFLAWRMKGDSVNCQSDGTIGSDGAFFGNIWPQGGSVSHA